MIRPPLTPDAAVYIESHGHGASTQTTRATALCSVADISCNGVEESARLHLTSCDTVATVYAAADMPWKFGSLSYAVHETVYALAARLDVATRPLYERAQTLHGVAETLYRAATTPYRLAEA